MKLVDYETFIRMPAGTIFAPYTPCIFTEGFDIKTDEGCEFFNPWNKKLDWVFNGTMSLEPWFEQDVWPDKCGTYKTEMAIYDNSSVDFDSKQMFAVLEPHEIKKLIKALEWALDGCQEDWEE